jgi:hypothetical protein
LNRIVKVLVATALMVVLMATTVSPALADHHTNNTNNNGKGWGVDGYNGGCDEGPAKAEGWGTSNEKGGYDACKEVNYKK